MHRLDAIVSQLAAQLKVKPEEIPGRVAGTHPWLE